MNKKLHNTWHFYFIAYGFCIFVSTMGMQHDTLSSLRSLVQTRSTRSASIAWQDFSHILDNFEHTMLAELRDNKQWLDPASAQQWKTGEWAVHFNPYVRRLIVKPGSKVAIWGDLHGSFSSLITSLETLCARGLIDESLRVISTDTYLIFLGDLVDRGQQSVEVLSIVLLLKIKNPQNVIIVRGNHEDASINEHYGFGQELRDKYGLTAQQAMRVYRIYDVLPVALYLSCGHPQALCSILCCHGAFEVGFNAFPLLNAPASITLHTVGKLERFERVAQMPTNLKKSIIDCFGIPNRWRTDKHENTDQLCSCSLQSLTKPYTLGFTWHDFVDDGSSTVINFRHGRGWVYGRQLTHYLLALDSSSHNQLIGIFRAHQHNGDMLELLRQHKGITQLWDHLVYTIVSGDSVGGAQVNGTFALVVPGRTQSEWRVYHGSDGFAQI